MYKQNKNSAPNYFNSERALITIAHEYHNTGPVNELLHA